MPPMKNSDVIKMVKHVNELIATDAELSNVHLDSVDNYVRLATEEQGGSTELALVTRLVREVRSAGKVQRRKRTVKQDDVPASIHSTPTGLQTPMHDQTDPPLSDFVEDPEAESVEKEASFPF